VGDKVIKAMWFGDGIMLSITAPPTTSSIKLTPDEAQQLIADLTRLFEAPDISEPPENLVRMTRKVP
jgi:hypothetical protein